MNPGPPSEKDPVIEAYKPGVDFTLILENLKLTPDQRLQQLQSAVNSFEELVRQRNTFHGRGGT
jgi:hypothetical protein